MPAVRARLASITGRPSVGLCRFAPTRLLRLLQVGLVCLQSAFRFELVRKSLVRVGDHDFPRVDHRFRQFGRRIAHLPFSARQCGAVKPAASSATPSPGSRTAVLLLGDRRPVPAALPALTLPVDSCQTDLARAQVPHLRRCGPRRAGCVMCETGAHSPSLQGSHPRASRLKPSNQIFTRFTNEHCAKNNRFYTQMEKYAQKNIKAISSFMHFCCRTPPGVRGLKLSFRAE